MITKESVVIWPYAAFRVWPRRAIAVRLRKIRGQPTVGLPANAVDLRNKKKSLRGPGFKNPDKWNA